ncbi:MAG TPA: YceI family protein [Mucilaginibacter sp.]|jgi:polyisoprenoid-binding protein YceI|nr:YceI family protein [Mucilaginibacter sp.]
MKNTRYVAIAAVIISLFAFTIIAANWKVKGDAIIEFTSSKVNGSFSGLKATIDFDKDHPEQAKFSASIDATSIGTGFFLKTMHAKDALGTDDHPLIKFVSTEVSKSGNAYLAKGNLTLKGITKPATIHFTFDDKGAQGVFKGDMKVIPKDFGIDRSGTPPEVMIKLTVPVVKS